MVNWGCAVCFQSCLLSEQGIQLPQDSLLLHSKGTCLLSGCNIMPCFWSQISFCAGPTYIVKYEQWLMLVDLTNYPESSRIFPEDAVFYLTICMPVHCVPTNLCLIFLSHESFKEVYLLKELRVWSVCAAVSPAERVEGNQKWTFEHSSQRSLMKGQNKKVYRNHREI